MNSASIEAQFLSDPGLFKRALVQVQHNGLLKTRFNDLLSTQSDPTGQLPSVADVQDISGQTDTVVGSYTPPPITGDYLVSSNNMHQNSSTFVGAGATPGAVPTVNVISYDGDEWGGILPTLLPALALKMPFANVVTALVQTLLGSRFGLLILVSLGVAGVAR